MQKDTIVYFGIIRFDKGNAMCQHARGIEQLIRIAGFRPIVIGVSNDVKRGSFKRIEESAYIINYPKNLMEQLQECFSSSEIKSILMEIGIKRIKAFIMADFRYIPMRAMKSYCDSKDIAFVVDIMDRFMLGRSINSMIKKIDCDIRMKHLYPSIDRRIYICSAYNELLGEGSHTAVIPGVTANRPNKPYEYKGAKTRLVFLGQPGKKCEKEKLDWVIQGIEELGLSESIELSIAGVGRKEFIDNNKKIARFLGDNIFFCDRLSHNECIELLEQSDFSIVIRPDTMLSKYGFSTKIGEAFSCGVPVLATNTSDNNVYIHDGINGYICGCTYEEVKQ